jgi:hypothetical protein
MKRCSKCKALKAPADFYRVRATPDGRRPDCKACFDARRKRWYLRNRAREIARVRAWQKANPDRVKASHDRNRERRNKQMREIHLRNKFGLTVDEYNRILEAQDGACALCDAPPTAKSSLHVDHDHGTGEIRGLLCMRCNNALGLFARIPICSSAPPDTSLSTRSTDPSAPIGSAAPARGRSRCEGRRRRLRVWRFPGTRAAVSRRAPWRGSTPGLMRKRQERKPGCRPLTCSRRWTTNGACAGCGAGCGSGACFVAFADTAPV